MQFFGCIFAVFWGVFCMMAGAWLFDGWGIILGTAVAVFTMGRMTSNVFDSTGGGSLWGDSEASLERGQVFSRIVFLTSGHIARADGQVTEDEIRCAEVVMEEYGMPTEQRAQAMHYFNRGTQPGFDLHGNLQELVQACRGEHSLIATFVMIQIAMACADGQFSPEEEGIIRTLCSVLGFPEHRIRVIVEQYLGKARQTRGDAPPAAKEDLDRAYGVLDVSPSTSMEEVQRAYARKMKDFHPDKLASKGLPKEFMEFATEQTKQFTRAYQAIKKAKREAG